MQEHRWRMIDDLFTRALKHKPEERKAYLLKACPGDASIREEVLSLIKSYEENPSFIETPAFEDDQNAGEDPGEKVKGRRIGPYRLVRRIASGGMGVVYEAEHQEVRRKVALKIIRGGEYADEFRIRLFQREVKTLARLTHPSIAMIHDAGCTEDGLHYFAMELVRGENMVHYVRRHKLPLRQRMRLFQKVCEAVGYAHQRGVIHRDLKPSNILVTREKAELEIKVLDFGLARFIDDEEDPVTRITMTGQMMGTMPYMSPEQCRGERENIGAHSDVFSLGVILYEMIADQPPFKIQDLPTFERARIICQTIPLKPSKVRPGLHADLEAVALKTLEKDPNRRYQSALALAEDMDRYLSGYSVMAHPPSTAYQLRRLVLRHKLPFAFAGILLLMITGFGILMSLLLVKSLEAEELAGKRLKEATEYADFLDYMIRSPDPGRGRGHDVKVKDVLDFGVKRLNSPKIKDLELKASLQFSLGRSYANLNMHDKAMPLLQKAYENRKEVLGEEHPETNKALNSLGCLVQGVGDFVEAEKLFNQLVNINRRVCKDLKIQAVSVANLARAKKSLGKYDEAEDLFLEGLDLVRKGYGKNSYRVGFAFLDLGHLSQLRENYDQAEIYFREALVCSQKAPKQNTLQVSYAMSCLGGVLAHNENHWDEAEELLRESLEMKLKPCGKKSRDYAVSQCNLGGFLTKRGRLEEAESLLREALKTNKEIFNDPNNPHPNLSYNLMNLGYLLTMKGDFEEAEEKFQTALEGYKTIYKGEHGDVARCMEKYAELLKRTHREKEAAEILVEARAMKDRCLKRK